MSGGEAFAREATSASANLDEFVEIGLFPISRYPPGDSEALDVVPGWVLGSAVVALVRRSGSRN